MGQNLSAQERPHLLDAVGRITTMMYYGMAVRTHGTKVSNGINLVFFADFGKLD
jgi:hypothetical protein